VPRRFIRSVVTSQPFSEDSRAKTAAADNLLTGSFSTPAFQSAATWRRRTSSAGPVSVFSTAARGYALNVNQRKESDSMTSTATIRQELNTIIAELPLFVRDPEVSLQLSRLRRLESRLMSQPVHGTLNRALLNADSMVQNLPVLGGALNRAATIPVASPAAGAIAAPAAMAGSLGAMLPAIVAVLLAIAAIALLVNLLLNSDRAIRTLGNLIQRAIDNVVAAREVIRRLAQEHPRSAFCMIHFEPILQILGKMATRLNSPVRGRPFLQGMLALAKELRDALKKLLDCLDPEDTLGLINRFFGPNGLITEALAEIKALIR
jgi:hypothetical protein